MSPASTIIAKNLGSTLTLNDGYKIPMFGLGTYRLSTGKGGEAETITSFALKHGYRLLDTAQFYGNEAEVGNGIIQSGIPREEVFVVTKLWTDSHGYDKCKKAFHKSLEKLKTKYIDLYLIHAPIGGKIMETYDAMLDLQKEGVLRSVGVSNFGIGHLEKLRLAGKPTPAVNQVELHPMLRRDDLVKYCRDHGIVVMGYSPLAKAKKTDEETLNKMAERYKKSWAQFMIRWSVQKGFITIPKSSLVERVKENAEVFDWSIEDEDMKTIDTIEPFNCAWDLLDTPLDE